MITKRNWIFSEDKSNALLILKIIHFFGRSLKSLLQTYTLISHFCLPLCQTTRGVQVVYSWSVQQMGCLKKKLFVSNKYLSVLQKVYSTNCYQNFQTLTVNKRKQTCLHCFFKPYKSRKMHNSTNKYYDGTYNN